MFSVESHKTLKLKAKLAGMHKLRFVTINIVYYRTTIYVPNYKCLYIHHDQLKSKIKLKRD